jgi:hypothetical protein
MKDTESERVKVEYGPKNKNSERQVKFKKIVFAKT